jgi:hypothetical protein
MVSCPRGCAVDVERGCLKGHLTGTCELEIITCVCGESTTRRERQAVLEKEQTEETNTPEPVSECIHEWRHCTGCSGRFQRLMWKV